MNREVTLLRGAEELERAGTLDNLRIAAGRASGERRGMVFSDSDVYKWLEALAWELGREPSAELERLARETTELVAAAQEPDGYLNSWCQVLDPAWRWTDLEMGHELYCAGHLFQAGVASARATGDTTLLTVACRFADLIDEVFGEDTDTRTDGHPEVEVALVELYRQTGRRRYLQLADTLTARRGYGMFAGGRFDLDYYQDAEPVRDARSIVGHAVRALYLAAGVTDIYAETGDEALLASMLRQWDDLTSSKTYLTGGVGSRHHGEAIGEPYELPPDRAYCETCAAIGSIMWNWRMLLVTGESRFADLLERTLYNGFLSGHSLDGESFFYMNPLQSRNGERRHRWNPVACCPPNVMRLLASLHHYLATVTETGVQLHQYASSTIRAVVPAAGPVELAVETGYPWSGTVAVDVVSSTDAEWTLSLRIPAWARAAIVDGEPVAPGEYATLTRRWRAGDRVVLELDVVAEAHRRRTRASTPFAAASRSNAARSSTASRSTTFRPAPIWPTSLSTLRPTPSTAGRSRSWAACPAWRWRASSATSDGWRQSRVSRPPRAAGGGVGSSDAAAGRSLLRVGEPGRGRDAGLDPRDGLGARRRLWRPCRSSR